MCHQTQPKASFKSYIFLFPSINNYQSASYLVKLALRMQCVNINPFSLFGKVILFAAKCRLVWLKDTRVKHLVGN